MRRVGFSFAKCFYGTRTWSGLGFLASTCLEISSSRSNGTVLRAVPIGDGTAPSGGNVAFLIRSPSGGVDDSIQIGKNESFRPLSHESESRTPSRRHVAYLQIRARSFFWF